MPARGTLAVDGEDSLAPRTRFSKRLVPVALLMAASVMLGGCASAIRNGPINIAMAADAPDETGAAPDAPFGNFEDTVVGLSFSGGGSRAAAFAYGVLREMGRTQISSAGRRSPLIDQVDLVSSVSGGSVTAAYFALKGNAILGDFENKFLHQDVEASLRTSVSLANIIRLSDGGVNDSTGLQSWLDENLFRNATYKDVFKRGRPALWINASDIYNRTPFVFNQTTFASLCSDISNFPLSEAVAASAAVPLVFAPVVMTNYADRCKYETPGWARRALANANSPAVLRANAETIQRYRENKDFKFVKLLDGGLTDNLGLTGILIERLGASAPYEPMSEREAVKMRRLLFVVVDAGRPPGGDWAKSVQTSAGDLIQAVADTAVDANVRNTYDTFAAQLRNWNKELIEWRCKLPPDRVQALLGDGSAWNCKDLSFHVVKVTFDQMPDPTVRAKLEAMPTRFKLEKENVDLLLDSAGAILRRNSSFQRFLASSD
ncbi:MULTISPECIES: patatin-like phospholipase family protein [Rhodomicrobium]|uniref:patatin-like phospholipase family protein n=1 Tax=Rhodomicrobium TaxID=1068 RepID=UPI000B4A86DD|nr:MULTISPECIES: patatin-like phospholipase family protein [Rhodomicrobium]